MNTSDQRNDMSRGYRNPNDTSVPADGMMDYVKKCFSKYADFSGRARRSEYWYFQLFNILITLAFYIPFIALAVAESNLMFVPLVLLIIYSLALFLPSLAVAVRRLHDTGRSGWYYLMGMIPLIGGIILLIFLVQDSVSGTNEWGPNPKNPGGSSDSFDENAFG